MSSWIAIVVSVIGGFLVWAYQALFPPSPRICGSPGGPPIQSPRIKLRDGRHLAYKEQGVPKEKANYKIILVHGFGSSRNEASMATSELVEKLGIYIVSFDRPGYGQSDPHPQRTIKSTALDIEELGDQLGLGSKFYVIGISMGGQVVWGCLKYISQRLAGAALIAPVVNYWWHGFPASLVREAYKKELVQDQWALWVVHYAPWLVHWWNTQKWFAASSAVAGRPNFTVPDLKVISQIITIRQANREYATQQGEYESIYRDLKLGFGKWEFDPMNIGNPFSDGEGSVHLWQGIEDGLVSVKLQNYIASKLPWIHYHELPNTGHFFAYTDKDIRDAILKTLLIGDK